MKIIIRGGALSFNEGAVAMTITALRIIKKAFPESDISIITPRYNLDIKREKLNKNLKIVKALYGKKGILKLLVYLIFRRKNSAYCLIKSYKEAELIVDVTGDTYSDDYGIKESLFNLFYLLVPVLMKKRILIMPQSIGPYNNRITKCLAKIIFKKLYFIAPREEITMSLLKEFNLLNIPSNTIIDLAFHMPAVFEGFSDTQIEIDQFKQQNRNIIGLSLSTNIASFATQNHRNERLFKLYQDVMIRLINHYASKGYVFVFIPHVVSDWLICDIIYNLINDKDKVILLKKNIDYLPQHLKAIISQCDIFIGARMHANIAALSSFVPTVAISYSHKTAGIMDMCGQLEYVVDVLQLDEMELIKKVDRCLQNKKEIHQVLKDKITPLKEQCIKSLIRIVKSAVKK